MALRAVLFDLGQTLLEYPGNTHEFWYGYLRERLADLQGTLRDMGARAEDTTEAFVERALDVVWPERKINMSGRSWHFGERARALLAACGREDCADGECEFLTDAFYRPIGEATQRYPETLEVLTTLSARGLRMAIISNAPWDVPGRLLRADMRRWEIEELFDAFVTSGDVPWRKPHPEFMWEAMRQLDVQPEECIVVGDSLQADIAGAQAAGMRSVWVNRDGSPTTGGGAPDWVLDDLRGLPEVVAGTG